MVLLNYVKIYINLGKTLDIIYFGIFVKIVLRLSF